MSSDDPFSLRLNPLKLRSRSKDTSKAAVDRSDAAGEKHGFEERAPKKKRGRKASPRTGQVHAKVMPNVSKEIAAEARRRGVQQGVLIEEAWALYKADKDG
ncbi:chromosome partitioning protein ParB [Sulfitobacter mediterraneus]|uniref:chromosome partitioning protein ParB n=1 Tax=Sulfitobacter mediterraneus TaxID=83219 RepID=UPI00248FDB53|nr:chromosome partitioning protein ParB [Sulfitobacter mediterraneus]